MIHLRQIHRLSKASYPACMFNEDIVQGITTVVKTDVTCPMCKKLSNFKLFEDHI
jgi:hypothetical protein